MDSTSQPEDYTCDFDLKNIELLSPAHNDTVSLPNTFTWQKRWLTSDDYEFNLFDPVDGDPWWWTVPSLGYVGNFTLNSLPTDFYPYIEYGWYLWVYGLDGYGISYYYHSVYFSNFGLTSSGVNIPISKLLPEKKLEDWISPHKP